MNDPVAGFMFALSGALIFIKAIAEVAFYLVGTLAFYRIAKELK